MQMKKDFLIRFSAVPLALLTLASLIFAVINFQKESQYLIPDDGVWWLDKDGTIQAQRLTPGGPGEQAGIKPGDKLLAVNEHPIHSVAGLKRHLDKTGYGVWSKPTYQLDRHGVKVQAPVILGQADKSLNFPLRLIALVYLGLGFYVLCRLWAAPKTLHFYCFALTSLFLYHFLYTGQLNTFDHLVL